MRIALITGALALVSLSVAGCSAFNSAVNAIDAPNTQLAVATLGKVATALICDLSSASATAQQVESGIDASAKVQGVTNEIFVASSLVCTKMTGTVVPGSGTNVNAVTAVNTTPVAQ